MSSTMLHNSEFKLRPMRHSDLDLVVQTEATSAEHPWTKRIFIDCLRAGYQCWVLASRDRIVGHGVLSVAIGESHLLTLCVHPEFQRMGYGQYILLALLDKAARLDAEVCFLEVRVSNHGARALYQTSGFVPIGQRKAYYPSADGREDAVIMSRLLTV